MKSYIYNRTRPTCNAWAHEKVFLVNICLRVEDCTWYSRPFPDLDLVSGVVAESRVFAGLALVVCCPVLERGWKWWHAWDSALSVDSAGLI